MDTTEPVSTVSTVMTAVESTTPPMEQSWLSRHLRNIIALALTGVVIYLAVQGDQAAQAAIVAAFSVLVGAIWGERASLKIPGREQ
jgi:hypothetical protein